MMRHWMWAALLTLTGCGQFIAYDSGAPPAQQTPAPVVTLDEYPEVDRLGHFEFGGLIARFTERDATGEYVVIDYVGWSMDEEAVFVLDRYMATLAGFNPSDLADESERFAYWINAYNAATIRGVLRDFGGDTGFSVLDDGMFFNLEVYTFGGMTMSLNQLENCVMRADLGRDECGTLTAEESMQAATWHQELFGGGTPDARLHAAINCGALGCPNLLDAAPYVYSGDKLEEQLQASTRAWLANPEKGAGPNGVSNLFEWFKADFEAEEGTVSDWIAKHREGGVDGVDVGTILMYDWTLNSL